MTRGDQRDRDRERAQKRNDTKSSNNKQGGGKNDWGKTKER